MTNQLHMKNGTGRVFRSLLARSYKGCPLLTAIYFLFCGKLVTLRGDVSRPGAPEAASALHTATLCVSTKRFYVFCRLIASHSHAQAPP